VIRSATQIWSNGKLKISCLFFFSFLSIAAGTLASDIQHNDPSQFDPDEQATVLVLPFSKYAFFAPKKMIETLREADSFDINVHVQERFEKLLDRLNDIDCDYSFSSLENETALALIQHFRFNEKDKSFVLDVEALSEEAQEQLTGDFDYVLILSQYHVDADLESKQPAHTVYFDLRGSDLSSIVASDVTGKLLHNKILDPKERESLVLKDLAKKLCQKISKN